MLMKRLISLGALTLTLVLGAMPLRASDPAGCYAIVERVVMEPSDVEPTTIQVWGAFALSGQPFTGNTYGNVQKGYMYFKCPKGSETACLAEWADLKRLAGKGEVIGFGNRYSKTSTRVRPAEQKPSAPDDYQLNIGIVRMGHYGNVTYPDLEKALRGAIGGK